MHGRSKLSSSPTGSGSFQPLSSAGAAMRMASRAGNHVEMTTAAPIASVAYTVDRDVNVIGSPPVRFHAVSARPTPWLKR